MTGFNMRFREGFGRLRAAAQSGDFGDVISVWSHRVGTGVGTGYNWRTDPAEMCGMTVESLSHDLDYLRWMAGEISSVRAGVLESQPDLPGFDDNVSVVLNFESGAVGNLLASWSSPLSHNSRGFIGRAGAAYFRGPDLWAAETFHWRTRGMPHEMVEVLNDRLDRRSYDAENRHFISSILDDDPLQVTAEDGLRALQLSHAILTSHHEKRVVVL
jgi:myo-inositol 2-dehydrogenase/D-chiro-inositol 1-dehydrogenase